MRPHRRQSLRREGLETIRTLDDHLVLSELGQSLSGVGRKVPLELGGISSASDLRAVYGGLVLGIGCFFLWSLRSGQLRPGLIVSVATFGGLVLGRIVSLVVDGVPERPGLLFLGSETLLVLLAALGLSREPRVS